MGELAPCCGEGFRLAGDGIALCFEHLKLLPEPLLGCFSFVHCTTK